MRKQPIFPMLALLALAACSSVEPSMGEAPAAVDQMPANVGAAASAPPPLDAGMQVADGFVVSTNEPFWQATVRTDTVVLKGLDGDRRLTVSVNEAVLDGRHVMASDASRQLEIRVTPVYCQDSMAGEEFPYTAKLAFDGGDPIMGCARALAE